MYHDYISRKSKPIKTNYNFVEDKEILLDIVYKMVQPNSENVYEQYHIYKELFSDFTYQIVSLDKQLKEKHVIFDISDNFVDEFKEVMIKEKSKSILELLKNKNVIYEKNV
jgi:hypothetical protein